MLSFFPTPYPDELLYSVFARYHARSGNTSPKVTLKELFGTTTATTIVDLPSYLNALISSMPKLSNYTAEELIRNHTLFPFYAPFLPKKRADEVLKSMRGNFGGDIHTRTGIMASSIKSPTHFRFCSKCKEEDKLKYGEAYWHRLHQIPVYWFAPFIQKF